MKLFDWRVTWDEYQIVANNVVMAYHPMVWLKVKPLLFSVEETELKFLNGKIWIPGKDKSGRMEVTTDLPLWKGIKDVMLILHCCRSKKDIERWHLKDAETDGKVISYKDVTYESCCHDKEESVTESSPKS